MGDLSGLGSTSAGVWTRGQALSRLTAGQVDGLVRRGVWQVVWRGVYADAGYELDPEQRAFAAVLAVSGPDDEVTRPGACVSGPPASAQTARTSAVAYGRTAARVWGLPLIDDDDPATGAREHRIDDVAVPRRVCAARSGERQLHTCEVSPRADELVRRPSGLRVTSVSRTLADCATLLSGEALVCAIDAALHRYLVSGADLTAALDGRQGRPGAPALRRAVSLADGRAESPAETLARLLLLPVLPGLVPQVKLFDRAGRVIARFDLGDRSVRFAVEADGKRGHAGTAMVAKDRQRDRATEGRGWTTERVTWFELRRQQASVVRRVARAHAARSTYGDPGRTA